MTHEDICKCFAGEEMVLHCKDVMLQAWQSVFFLQEGVGSRPWAAQQHQVEYNVSSDAVMGLSCSFLVSIRRDRPYLLLVLKE